MSKYTMQSTVSSQPPRQICTHFLLFCSPPPRESRVSGYSWRSQFRLICCPRSSAHYSGVIMGTMASQITIVTIVYWTIYSDTDQRKHPSSGSLAFFQGIHRWPINSPHKGPVTRKMLPFHDVIMWSFLLIVWDGNAFLYHMKVNEGKFNYLHFPCNGITE